MASGSVTIHGGSGTSAFLTINSGNDGFGLAAASTFQSLTAQIESSASGFFGYSAGSTFLALEDGLGNTGVTGPTGASTLLGGNGTNIDYVGPTIGGSTSALIVGGDGNDLVLSGIGQDTMALGAGHNFYLLGAGGLVESAGTDLVIGGIGSTVVNVSGDGSTVAGGEVPGSTLLINAGTGTHLTVFSTSGTTVVGASSTITTVNGAGSTTVNAGHGGTTYIQSGGTLLLNGLTGETDNVTVGAGVFGNDTLYGASGSVINFTGSTHNNIFVANDSNHGGAGSSAQTADFNGASASGGNQFWAGSGNATLIGGAGNDTLVAGSGSSTLTGGTGAANEFDLFSANGGANTHVTITDFGAVSSNFITLFGYGTSGVQTAIASQAQQPNGGGTLITLGDHSTILLQGVNSVTSAAFRSSEPTIT